MKSRIAVLPGDGIGPEVMNTTVEVLEAVGRCFGHQFDLQYYLVGGASHDKYNTPLSPSTLNQIKRAEAILLGAVGGPKWDNLPPKNRPEHGLLTLRKELGLFANLRPVKVYPELANHSPIKKEIIEDTDILFVRELTSGIYFGQPRGRRKGNQEAFDTSCYSYKEVERVAKVAFDLSRKRRKKVTSVDKANVLETSRLWRQVVTEVAKNYKDIELEHLYVDNAAMQLIKKPTAFDVILTENMFGDILTDEAAVISASIGLLPSASIGDHHPFLYEPIHGSAPKHAGKNKANPIGAILSAALMLRYSFLLEKEARAIEQAVEKALKEGARTYDIATREEKVVTTREMGDTIYENIMTNF